MLIEFYPVLKNIAEESCIKIKLKILNFTISLN